MANETPAPKGSFLSNRHYDLFKWVAQIGLPSVGTLYFALAGLWGLPASEEVVGTIVALDAFLGALLGLSSKQYDATASGTMVVSRSEDGEIQGYSMELEEDPTALADKKEVRFKIKDQ